MAFKQPGVPMMDTSKKHGTNANFGKSGMNDKNGKPVKAGAPGFFGKLMDPLGLKKKIGGLFGKGGGKGCPPAAAAAAPVAEAAATPGVQGAGPATPPPVAAPPVEEPVPVA
tara:strand:- start:26 stop:361 length:336 start_codon:yes stop_codon:yes gene_type:complete